MSYLYDSRRKQIKKDNDIPRKRRGMWLMKVVKVVWPNRRREKCAPYGSGYGTARMQLKLKYYGL